MAPYQRYNKSGRKKAKKILLIGIFLKDDELLLVRNADGTMALPGGMLNQSTDARKSALIWDKQVEKLERITYEKTGLRLVVSSKLAQLPTVRQGGQIIRVFQLVEDYKEIPKSWKKNPDYEPVFLEIKRLSIALEINSRDKKIIEEFLSGKYTDTGKHLARVYLG